MSHVPLRGSGKMLRLKTYVSRLKGLTPANVQKEARFLSLWNKNFCPGCPAAGKRDGSSRRPSLRNSSSSRECLSRLSHGGHSFCMRACAGGERAAASLSQGGIAALPGGNVQQDVLVLSRPQHYSCLPVAHEPLSAPSRSPTSQTVMRSGSFIPYHLTQIISGAEYVQTRILTQNSCSRHCSRGSLRHRAPDRHGDQGREPSSAGVARL